MDETTVFKGASVEDTTNVPVQAANQPLLPPQELQGQNFPPSNQAPKQPVFDSPLYEQPLYNDTTPPEIPPSSPPPNNKGKNPLQNLNAGLLLKIGIGIIGVLVMIFLIFLFSKLFLGSSKQVTLIYWGLWEDKNVVNTVISDYERTHANIKINYIKQDPKDYKDRLLAYFKENSKEAPDIFRFHNTWTGELANRNSSILSPLPSSVVTKTDFQNTYYPVASSDLIINNAPYGIPLEIDTLSLFVNSDILEAHGVKPPTDLFKEFGDDARSMTVSSNGTIVTAGAGLGKYDSVTHAPDIIAMLMAQDKGGVNFAKIADDQNKVSETLSYYTQFAQGNNAVWSDKLGTTIDAFAAGNLAMYFGYSWDIPLIQHANPALRFQVVPVPVLQGVTYTTVASYWVEGVALKSQHQKEAMDFLHYLSQKDTVQKLYTEESKTRSIGEPYARMDLADSLRSNKLAYPFVQQAKTATSSYFAADTGDKGLDGQANEQLQISINSILSQTGATSPETESQRLAKNLPSIISNFGY